MKLSTSLIASAVLLASSSVALAATNQNTINIKVTQDEFVNLIGTAFTPATGSHVFTVADLVAAQTSATPLSLGTLGTESNILGNCGITFSSANSYELKNGSTSLVAYSLNYNGTDVSTTPLANQACQYTPTAIDFLPSAALPAANTIAAGDYTDVVTVTVTSI